MLHMIVNTHNAESCAYRSDADEKIFDAALVAVNDKAADFDVTLKGSWVHRGTHEIFFLLDAPNAHAVETLFLEAGLVGRTHSRILPVVDTSDVMAE